MAWRTMLIAIAMVCSSCATRYQASPGSTEIAPSVEFAIPTGRELGYSIQVTQLITAHFRGQSQAFQAYVSISQEKVTLIAMDPLGGRALTVVATDEGIHTEAASIVPAVLRAGNILADMAIVYWPVVAVRRGLVSTSASLYEEGNERTISFKDHVVVQVVYDNPHEATWPESAHLHNFAYGYELDLRSTITGR